MNNYCDIQDNCEVVKKYKQSLLEIQQKLESIMIRNYFLDRHLGTKKSIVEVIAKINEVLDVEND